MTQLPGLMKKSEITGARFPSSGEMLLKKKDVNGTSEPAASSSTSTVTSNNSSQDVTGDLSWISVASSSHGSDNIVDSSESTVNTDDVLKSDFSSVNKRIRLSSTVTSTVTSFSTGMSTSVIPLPPPPNTNGVGSACGGNQSYLGMKDASLQIDSNRYIAPSQDLFDGNFGSSNTRPPGVVGLHNLGNTCFMASGLQCLINTPAVVEFFLKSATISGIAPSKCALTLQFQALVRNAWHSNVSSIWPRAFKDVLGNIRQEFRDCRQHDCQEFLLLALDILHEQLKVWNNKKKALHETNSSGFASGPVDSICGESNSVSTVDESDVSSSLQSPASGSTIGEETICNEESPNKRRRLTDEIEPSTSNNNNENDLNMEDETDSETETPEEKVTKDRRKAAEGFWMNYIRDNNTVIASSFHGLSESTVTCSGCKNVSRTHEPFTTLSLPIPRTSERKFDVFFVNTRVYDLKKVEVVARLDSNVGKLKEQIVNTVRENLHFGKSLSDYVLGEVVNHDVQRILKDETSVKNINNGPNIYLFELNDDFDETISNISSGPLETYKSEEQKQKESEQPVANGRPDTTVTESINEENSTNSINSLEMCTVCLEEFSKDKVKQHVGCSCILCEVCLKKTEEYYKPSEYDNCKGSTDTDNPFLKCPVCSEVVDYKTAFVSKLAVSDTARRTLVTLPVLFRNRKYADSSTSADTDSAAWKLIGHPLLVKLPSSITAQEFYETMNKIHPFPAFKFTTVTQRRWDGEGCGKCSNSTCTGCEFPKSGLIWLTAATRIVLSYHNLPECLLSQVTPVDMAKCAATYSTLNINLKQEQPIDICDCFEAFSAIENLDQPYKCPNCNQNQQATKFFTICRFPDFLIIHLKRFEFVANSSIKLNNRLKFPLEDLNVSKYIAEFAGGEHVYDLYSCVCHFGTASGGHYTAYSKNPKSGCWNYFNDATVISQAPGESDYSSAYILFYAKKGLKSDIPIGRIPVSTPSYFNFSVHGDSDYSKGQDTCDTTSSLPDCTLNLGGPHIFDGEVSLILRPQESTVSSTSTDPSEEPPLFYQPVDENDVPVPYLPFSATTPDKVNCVRENVSNMCIDSTTTRKRSLRIDNMETGDSDEISASATESDSPTTIENKRLTKVAQRSRTPITIFPKQKTISSTSSISASADNSSSEH